MGRKGVGHEGMIIQAIYLMFPCPTDITQDEASKPFSNSSKQYMPAKPQYRPCTIF